MHDHFKEIVRVTELFETFTGPWCVCGGWALDLFLERKTREHSDVEVFLFRRDQLFLQEYLRDWNLYYVNDGVKKSWPAGEYLQPPIHELWATKEPESIELLLNDTMDNDWVYRRNHSIRLPLSNLIFKSKSGIPFLNPSVVLLFKSKHLRPKDDTDFEMAWPHLNTSEQEFLYNCLLQIAPGHPWISKFK